MSRKKATKAKKILSGGGGKRGLNAADYVRGVAQANKSAGCGVCCYPSVKKKLDEIFEQMDAQNVKISAAQLRRDLQKHYTKFQVSDKKFRDHVRDCLERA